MTRNRPPSIMATMDRARPRGVRPPVAIPPTSSISGNALASLLGIEVPSTATVSEQSVTGIPAVQSGIDMIAHGVAAMMVDADCFDRTADGHVEGDPPPFVARPSTLLGGFEFYVQLIDCLMKRGNWIGIKADFDTDGYPRQLVPVHPDAASLDDSTGFPIYTIGSAVYRWDEVVHLRHAAPVGSFWGQGVVERYRKAVQRNLYEAEYANNAFASGGVPSAVIQLDKPTVTDDEAEAVQSRWLERHGDGSRKPAVTGRALNITPLSWSPEDAEFIESRRLSIAEGALMVGLDPADLGASIGGGGLTYANLTDRTLSRVVNSFSPWMRIVEEGWSQMLPSTKYVRGKIEALLRSSTKDRYEMYAVGLDLGIYTPEELRELERRPKLPADAQPPSTPPDDEPEEGNSDEQD